MNMVIILSEVFCCHGYPTKEAEARGAGQRAGNSLQSEKPSNISVLHSAMDILKKDKITLMVKAAHTLNQ